MWKKKQKLICLIKILSNLLNINIKVFEFISDGDKWLEDISGEAQQELKEELYIIILNLVCS